MKKYMYILCGVVDPDEPLSNFRLISPNTVTKQYSGSTEVNTSGIRVDVANINLTKYSCDSYSTTESNIKIKDLDPKVFILKNLKWGMDNNLTQTWLNKKVEPHEFYEYLENHGLVLTMRGYFTEDHLYEYQEYKESLIKDCIPIIRDWINKNCDNEDKKIVNDNLIENVANKTCFYRKSEWNYFIPRFFEEEKETLEGFKKFIKEGFKKVIKRGLKLYRT